MELVFDRAAYLCRLVVNRSVPDIGVVEHTREAMEGSQWLHRHLKRCAASCLGVDAMETEVKQLNERGYNVMLADVTQAPLRQKMVKCWSISARQEAWYDASTLFELGQRQRL